MSQLLPAALFGYGSLLFKPELPTELIEARPARLLGHRRAFSVRSNNRFCARAESFDAFPEASPPTFSDELTYRSLVLGTMPCAACSIEGKVLLYPEEVAEELWRLTDAREGYDQADLPGSCYLRREIEVELLDGGGRLACQTYLAHQQAEGGWVLAAEMRLGQRARILINATPRVPRSDDCAVESRGVYYLEGVREQLLGVGIVDKELEALAAAIRAEEGPWVALVAKPR
jgi:cation transport regulator ChaC